MTKGSKKNYDVAVIGGGPAGMTAGIFAAKSGARAVILEKNSVLGKKLLLTGGGRCNFANEEKDLRKLVANYGKTGPFLFHAFSGFGPSQAVGFFNGMGVKTVTENNGRIFPESGRATDILEALEGELKKEGVEIRYESPVAGIRKKDGAIVELALSGGDSIRSKNYILAVGGKSYPATGSSGDGYVWARELGHRVEAPKPALVPLKTSEDWAKKLSGVGLKRAGITVYQNDKKVAKDSGELLFTHFGLSGPAILALSLRVGELMEGGRVSIGVNLLPESNLDALDRDLHTMFIQNPNRQIANTLGKIIPQSLAGAVCEIAGVIPQKTANDVMREERRRLAGAILDMRLTVAGLLDIEAGMVTGGGVDVGDIDDKTMRSKIIGNLYFAGEIINVHGRTGGFNLLQCWSTGKLAGISAAEAQK